MASYIGRRKFLATLGAAAAWPLAAHAQQRDQVQRIGVMLGFNAGDPEAQPLIAAFKRGLQDLGWVEGRNIEFDYRWPAADPELIRAYAAELVRTTPSVILVNSTPATAIFRQETRTVPIVFVNIADPGSQWLRCEPGKSGWQSHRLDKLRRCNGRQVARTAQGDRA
jgi:ABC-type uncharacterized transport system substrate-binding protein